MSKQASRGSAEAATADSAKAVRRQPRRPRAARRTARPWIIVAVVLAVGGALVFALASSSDKKSGLVHQADTARAGGARVEGHRCDGRRDRTQSARASITEPSRFASRTRPRAEKDGKPRIIYQSAPSTARSAPPSGGRW